MILKIQRPLARSPGVPDVALCYDRNRKNQRQISMTPELRKLIGSRPKIYAEAEYVGDTIKVSKILPDQPW